MAERFKYKPRRDTHNHLRMTKEEERWLRDKLDNPPEMTPEERAQWDYKGGKLPATDTPTDAPKRLF